VSNGAEMKLETYLSAMELSHAKFRDRWGRKVLSSEIYLSDNRFRQYRAFRERILDIFDIKDKAFHSLTKRCRELIDELEVADKRIAELEKIIEIMQDAAWESWGDDN